MNFTGDSLSGQNKGRRAAGTGSSPVLPTKSERTRLWKQLRSLDSRIAVSKEFIRKCWHKEWIEKELSKQKAWDLKRKQVRLKLKGYK